jgi:repressor LexA
VGEPRLPVFGGGPSRLPLSPRQRDAFEAIAAHLAAHGYAPTTRELCGLLGVRSTNAVSDLLFALEKKGAIRVRRGRTRGIELPGAPVPALAPAPCPRCAPRIAELERQLAEARRCG